MEPETGPPRDHRRLLGVVASSGGFRVSAFIFLCNLFDQVKLLLIDCSQAKYRHWVDSITRATGFCPGLKYNQEKVIFCSPLDSPHPRRPYFRLLLLRLVGYLLSITFSDDSLQKCITIPPYNTFQRDEIVVKIRGLFVVLFIVRPELEFRCF